MYKNAPNIGLLYELFLSGLHHAWITSNRNCLTAGERKAIKPSEIQQINTRIGKETSDNETGMLQ